MLAPLKKKTENLLKEFGRIPADRKELLEKLSKFIQDQITAGKKASLNFICTHNSRRSHIAQLWAQAAAFYYNVPAVECYSGGTEATAFNPRAVKAMQDAGFGITKIKEGDNPVYEVKFSENKPPVKVFSKKYDDPFNPDREFAAVMTCSHADENCPLVAGASARIALTYDDPKDFDGKPEETVKYKERVDQIGREILYAFSLVKS